MRDRELNLNVRLKALAEDRDVTASAFVRHMIRKAHARRFGKAAHAMRKGRPS